MSQGQGSQNKFTKGEREAVLLRVADLYLTGHRQAAIADEIGVSHAMMSGYIKMLHKRWEAVCAEKIDKLRGRELAKLDRLEAEAWLAWTRSQADAETLTETSSPQGVTTTKKKEGQTGDVRFLTIVDNCVQRRCQILGLNAPTKVAPTDPTGKLEYAALDDGRIQRLNQLLAAAAEARGGSAGVGTDGGNTPDGA